MDRRNPEGDARHPCVGKIHQAPPENRVVQVAELLLLGNGLGAHTCRPAKTVKIGQPVFRQKFKDGQTAPATEGFSLTAEIRAAQRCAAVETFACKYVGFKDLRWRRKPLQSVVGG